MRLLIEIRRIEVSFGIAGFFTVMHKPTAVIHSYPQKSPQVFDNSSGSEKSGLIPPSPPPQSATHQSLAHTGDFVQFPIRQKRHVPAKDTCLKIQ